MAQKYYAVRTGKKPGIYNTWEECKAVVDGYPGAQYKSFKTREEAEAFAGVSGAAGIEKKEKAATDIDGTKAYAFVDGSYHAKTGVYGYGGFLVYDGKRESRCRETEMMLRWHPCAMSRGRSAAVWRQ